MGSTAVSRHHRRGVRGGRALATAATLTAMAAVLATGSPPAQATRTHTPEATAPDATAHVTGLFGVSAVSKTDAWAVGEYLKAAGLQLPFILHWNGTAWKTVPSPTPSGATFTFLTAVTAVSATDAWAAGYYQNNGAPPVPLILHWNGTAWKKVPSPNPSGADGTQLTAVTAASPTDAWAAGYYSNGPSGPPAPLILHWNGTAWKQVTSPTPSGANGTQLTAVTAHS